MIDFYKSFLWIMVTIFAYYNFFTILDDNVMIGIYPYVLGLTFISLIILPIMYFVEVPIVVKMIKIVMAFICIFTLFTFFQIWRNAKSINNHQLKIKEYIHELTEVTQRDDKENIQLKSEYRGISSLIKRNTGIPPTVDNEAFILWEGEKNFDEIIESINMAKHHIHMEFFILRDDRIGEKIKDLLIEKAQEGIKVRVLYDGIGSSHLKATYRKEMREAGIQIEAYDPFWKSILKGRLNHRNHRKILIIDGTIGFTGGINIGDEYLNRDRSIGEWKDVQLKIKGEAVAWMQKVFLTDWYYVTGEKILDESYFPGSTQKNQLVLQVLTSGYDTRYNEMSQTYFSMVTEAKEKINIATPYLVLTDSMLKALQTAALKGVEVRIVLPKKPDLFLVGWTNASFFEELLTSSVKIYEHTNGFLHSKVIIIDDKILSIGSSNLNTRSLHLDDEMNVIAFDQELCTIMEEEFERYIRDSEEIVYEKYKKRSLMQRFKEHIGKIFIPLI